MSVRLFSTLAVRLALDTGGLAAFSAQTGRGVETVYDPTNVLLTRIEAGERPDVMVGVAGQLTELEAAGVLQTGTVRDIARVGVGIAAAPGGTPLPDVSDTAALVATLRTARSVAYSRTGASGVYFARLLDELGIADEVNARATVVEKGFTADALLDGRADLAVQQLSELRFVPAARLVGPLPDPVQHFTPFAVAIGADAADQDGAQALADHLASAAMTEHYLAAGLDLPAVAR